MDGPVVEEVRLHVEARVALDHVGQALADAAEHPFEEVGNDERDLLDRIRAASSVDQGCDLLQIVFLIGAITGHREEVFLGEGPSLKKPRKRSRGAAVAQVDTVDQLEAIEREAKRPADSGVAERLSGVVGDHNLKLDGRVEWDLEVRIVREVFAQRFHDVFCEREVDPIELTAPVARVDRGCGHTSDDDAVGVGSIAPTSFRNGQRRRRRRRRSRPGERSQYRKRIDTRSVGRASGRRIQLRPPGSPSSPTVLR